MVRIDDLHPPPPEDDPTPSKFQLKLQILFHDVKQWISDHPFVVGGAIAGVLFSLAASKVPLLIGFGRLGPVKLSYAAEWMRSFQGSLPSALYSSLQSFGMTLNTVKFAKIGIVGAITGATAGHASQLALQSGKSEK